jgi:hypothetical protein
LDFFGLDLSALGNLRQVQPAHFFQSLLCGGKKPLKLLSFFRRRNHLSDVALAMLG